MKDIIGTELEPGQTIKRVIDDGTKFVGREYEVITYDFTNSKPDGEDLCAKGYEEIVLLYPERAKEFEVIK